MLQLGVVAGQATITAAAQEKLFPNRAALCHFYVDVADFDRERLLLDRLTKHVPGQTPTPYTFFTVFLLPAGEGRHIAEHRAHG